MKKHNDFEYKYVAPTNEERKEIENIKNSYLTQSSFTDSKLNKLRKLDGKVKNIPVIISLVLGIVGTLIFGLGMSMALEWNLTLWGIIVSAVGFVPTICAYPAYKFWSKNLKKKYSAEIINLSNELLNDEKEKV